MRNPPSPALLGWPVVCSLTAAAIRRRSANERQAAEAARREEARYNAIAHYDDQELNRVSAEVERLREEGKALGPGGYYASGQQAD